MSFHNFFLGSLALLVVAKWLTVGFLSEGPDSPPSLSFHHRSTFVFSTIFWREVQEGQDSEPSNKAIHFRQKEVYAFFKGIKQSPVIEPYEFSIILLVLCCFLCGPGSSVGIATTGWTVRDRILFRSRWKLLTNRRGRDPVGNYLAVLKPTYQWSTTRNKESISQNDDHDQGVVCEVRYKKANERLNANVMNNDIYMC